MMKLRVRIPMPTKPPKVEKDKKKYCRKNKHKTVRSKWSY